MKKNKEYMPPRFRIDEVNENDVICTSTIIEGSDDPEEGDAL